ncbi:cell division protein ZapA [mine drainage metagenome]|uniref:Cell division protein ZapA n=1 Tax=mine drainage metagenome TaxID=410659 RepID=A0A1J5RXB4_9ZZZZ
MASTVAVTIVGRTYELNCDEGQESYLQSLAAAVDERAAELLRHVGQVGDARLLVMVALSMADEMIDLKGAVSRQEEALAAARPPAAGPSPEQGEADGLLASGIESLARKIEAIAERLEKA